MHLKAEQFYRWSHFLHVYQFPLRNPVHSVKTSFKKLWDWSELRSFSDPELLDSEDMNSGSGCLLSAGGSARLLDGGSGSRLEPWWLHSVLLWSSAPWVTLNHRVQLLQTVAIKSPPQNEVHWSTGHEVTTGGLIKPWQQPAGFQQRGKNYPGAHELAQLDPLWLWMRWSVLTLFPCVKQRCWVSTNVGGPRPATGCLKG